MCGCNSKRTMKKFFDVGHQDYYGAARVKYYGKHSGQLSVYKSEDGSIGFDSYVDKMWLWEVPLNITCLFLTHP